MSTPETQGAAVKPDRQIKDIADEVERLMGLLAANVTDLQSILTEPGVPDAETPT